MVRPPPAAWLLATTLLACHIGPPPAPASGAPRPGRVLAPVAEPGLADALESGLGTALAERGGEGRAGAGPWLEAQVLDATTEVVAVSADRRVHRVRLSVAYQLLGPAPTRLVLQGERSYVVLASDGLSAAQARADAFDALCVELSRDAAAWATQAPGPALALPEDRP